MAEHFESKEGGFDPLEYESLMRDALDLEQGASDKKVEEVMNETNALAVRKLLGLIPEATDMDVLIALRERKMRVQTESAVEEELQEAA